MQAVGYLLAVVTIQTTVGGVFEIDHVIYNDIQFGAEDGSEGVQVRLNGLRADDQVLTDYLYSVQVYDRP
jgi:hypothetical protein